MTNELRYAESVQEEGPVTVHLSDGVWVELASIYGGGQFMEGERAGEYEVHGIDLDGEHWEVPQAQIERVTLVATGEELEFGNPYVGPHPRPLDLDGEA
jgi:hypothetical protein